MSWTAPMTFTAGNVLTAAQLNTHLRDNLLMTAPALATTAGRIFVATGTNAIAERAIAAATVETGQTTTSTTYTDLTTTGPAVTVTTGTKALVIVTAHLSNNTATAHSNVGYAVSGASTIAAADAVSLRHASGNVADFVRMSMANLEEGLTAGSNTFTAKYRVGSGTGTFTNRRIKVIAL